MFIILNCAALDRMLYELKTEQGIFIKRSDRRRYRLAEKLCEDGYADYRGELSNSERIAVSFLPIGNTFYGKGGYRGIVFHNVMTYGGALSSFITLIFVILSYFKAC